MRLSIADWRRERASIACRSSRLGKVAWTTLASTGLCLALEARKSSVAESPICSSSSRSESAIPKRPPRAAQLVRGQGRRVFSSGPAFRCNAETALVALRACHPAEGPSRRGERANDEKASSARRHRSSSPAATTTSMSAVSDLSTSLLERIRGLDAENASAEHRQLVITQLAQTLARDARDLRQDRKAVAVRDSCYEYVDSPELTPRCPQETIFEDPFPLFDFLVPLLASEGVQSAIEDEDFPVKGWLCLIARQSSPREVIMAVEQHQATLRPSRIAAESDGDTIQETLRSFSAQHAALVEVVALGEWLPPQTLARKGPIDSVRENSYQPDRRWETSSLRRVNVCKHPCDHASTRTRRRVRRGIPTHGCARSGTHRGGNASADPAGHPVYRRHYARHTA